MGALSEILTEEERRDLLTNTLVDAVEELTTNGDPFGTARENLFKALIACSVFEPAIFQNFIAQTQANGQYGLLRELTSEYHGTQYEAALVRMTAAVDEAAAENYLIGQDFSFHLNAELEGLFNEDQLVDLGVSTRLAEAHFVAANIAQELTIHRETGQFSDEFNAAFDGAVSDLQAAITAFDALSSEEQSAALLSGTYNAGVALLEALDEFVETIAVYGATQLLGEEIQQGYVGADLPVALAGLVGSVTALRSARGLGGLFSVEELRRFGFDEFGGVPLPGVSSRTRSRIDLQSEILATNDGDVVFYDYGTPDIHGINAAIDENGIVGFDIRSNPDFAPTLGSGGDMFNSVIQRITSDNHSINGIRGTWLPDSGSTNYRQYNELLGRGISPAEAASRTWTGRQAAAHGFTVAEQISGTGNTIRFIFRRP